MRESGGFTLIELILVTVIIGILAGMVVVNYSGRAEDARIKAAQGDIALYQNAIDLYALDHNDRYPKALNDLVGGTREYLKSGIKRDPWGKPYVYVCPGKHRTRSYDIYSLGPDGQGGTPDDITSWDSSAAQAK